MASAGELEADMCFLGLTRPPMFYGVSYTVVMAYFLILMMYFVLSSNLLAFLAMPVLHGIFYVPCQKEPLWLELFMVRQQNCNRCKNKMFHGMRNSYDVS